MKELNLEETIQNRKLKFNINIFDAIFEFIFPLIILFGIYLNIYAFFNLGFSLILVLLLMIQALILYWCILAYLKKGVLSPLLNVNKSDIIRWSEQEKYKNKVINRESEGYLMIRDTDWANGSYFREDYIIFDEDKVYVTSIAVGKLGDSSSFYYFMNKSKTEELITELNEFK